VRTRIPSAQWNKGLLVLAAERHKIKAHGASRG
jgi:hypothetical protein